MCHDHFSSSTSTLLDHHRDLVFKFIPPQFPLYILGMMNLLKLLLQTELILCLSVHLWLDGYEY